MFKVLKNNIPAPHFQTAFHLAEDLAPSKEMIPRWVVEAIQIAYQNGRYDEASAETRWASLD